MEVHLASPFGASSTVYARSILALLTKQTDWSMKMSTRICDGLPAVLGLVLAVFVFVPSSATAAVADADTRRSGGLLLGSASFKAAPGEANRLEISTDSRGQVVLRDPAVPVRARGDCKQLGEHAATCPRGEFVFQVFLRDGADRVRAGGLGSLGHVFGGPGDDALWGETNYDILFGGSGDDRLHGGRGTDTLTGGPGHDRLGGGNGDDILVDGETDGEAARDVFVGGASRDTAGADAGDIVSYRTRRRDIKIDLAGRPAARTSTEDVLRGFESVVGGSGDDRLRGDADDNNLDGGPGGDSIRARGGRDIPSGDAGDDRVDGGSGGDVVWGDAGDDQLFGGRGDDLVIPAEEEGPNGADRVDCGAGQDTARSEHHDTLTAGCERAASFRIGVDVQPAIEGDRAEFTIECLPGTPEPCPGELSLFAADGTPYGSSHFEVPADETQAVVVDLNAAGAADLADGSTVQVEFTTDDPADSEAGYRAFMRG